MRLITILFLSLFFFGSACTNRNKEKAKEQQVAIVTDEEYYKIAKELKATESSSEIFINLPTDVIFDEGQATLTEDSFSWLEGVVKMINAKGVGNVMITGFSDDSVEPAIAQKLSAERAKAVADWINGQKLKISVHISSQGVGNRFGLPNKNPDGSDNPENQAKNRRVEIVIKKANPPQQ